MPIHHLFPSLKHQKIDSRSSEISKIDQLKLNTDTNLAQDDDVTNKMQNYKKLTGMVEQSENIKEKDDNGNNIEERKLVIKTRKKSNVKNTKTNEHIEKGELNKIFGTY